MRRRKCFGLCSPSIITRDADDHSVDARDDGFGECPAEMVLTETERQEAGDGVNDLKVIEQAIRICHNVLPDLPRPLSCARRDYASRSHWTAKLTFVTRPKPTCYM